MAPSGRGLPPKAGGGVPQSRMDCFASSDISAAPKRDCLAHASRDIFTCGERDISAFSRSEIVCFANNRFEGRSFAERGAKTQFTKMLQSVLASVGGFAYNNFNIYMTVCRCARRARRPASEKGKSQDKAAAGFFVRAPGGHGGKRSGGCRGTEERTAWSILSDSRMSEKPTGAGT